MTLTEAAVFLRVAPQVLLAAARDEQVPSRHGADGSACFSRAELVAAMTGPVDGGDPR